MDDTLHFSDGKTCPINIRQKENSLADCFQKHWDEQQKIMILSDEPDHFSSIILMISTSVWRMPTFPICPTQEIVSSAHSFKIPL